MFRNLRDLLNRRRRHKLPADIAADIELAAHALVMTGTDNPRLLACAARLYGAIGAKDAAADAWGMHNRAKARQHKPTGPMIYTVEKGADVFPRWLKGIVL